MINLDHYMGHWQGSGAEWHRYGPSNLIGRCALCFSCKVGWYDIIISRFKVLIGNCNARSLFEQDTIQNKTNKIYTYTKTHTWNNRIKNQLLNKHKIIVCALICYRPNYPFKSSCYAKCAIYHEAAGIMKLQRFIWYASFYLEFLRFKNMDALLFQLSDWEHSFNNTSLHLIL